MPNSNKNVLQLCTKKDSGLTANDVLSKAKDAYDDVITLGYNKEGHLEVRSSSGLDHKQVNWLISQFQHKLLSGDYSENG
jgi:hypothetical protein